MQARAQGKERITHACSLAARALEGRAPEDPRGARKPRGRSPRGRPTVSKFIRTIRLPGPRGTCFPRALAPRAYGLLPGPLGPPRAW